MKVKFNLDTIKPMSDWLLNHKNNGIKDENALRDILSMDDYRIEFERYSLEGLPVCGISFEEAIDFFMNFDNKDFENPRLQSKKPSFLEFYNDIENRLALISKFIDLNDDDLKLVENLLSTGLPDNVLQDIPELTIIIIISIGNSMGWPYESYIDYDASNLNLFTDKNDFLHVTAHEINHIFVGNMLGPDGIKPEELFLQLFAYEGLAVHYNNNQDTLHKARKYNDEIYGMQELDMKFYTDNFDVIFNMIKDDYNKSKNMSFEEVQELVSKHYEQFEFMNHPIKQYPTYYFGCYMWGLVDLKYGKERLYEAINKPSMFIELYNSVAEEKYKL